MGGEKRKPQEVILSCSQQHFLNEELNESEIFYYTNKIPLSIQIRIKGYTFYE